jgi:formylglycine-generating enzyme required for sulfatase activity
MFSTAPGTVAADGEKDKRNNPFAEAFLKFMDSTEILPVVASHITRETMTLTGGKQRPFQNGSIVSEVYYSLNPASNAAAPVPAGNYSAAPAPGRASAASLAVIPAGTFTMGSPVSENHRYRDEVQHRVSVKSFLLEAHEVTQKSYREIMGINPSSFQGDNLPVEQVSWFDAVNYCNKRSIAEGLDPVYVINGENVNWNRSANGYRLPTEAEWEYACRAGSSAPFSTGNNITTNQANYNGTVGFPSYGPQGSFRERTVTVGSFLPNSWGLYDMHGNVYEWCWDWLAAYPDTASDYAGPASGTEKVARGGSWYHNVPNMRAAYRDASAPASKQPYLGFRVARNGE